MPAHHSIADVASLIGEPTRARMLLALLGGQERPASDLAREAQLSAAATSLHLGKLVAGGLLAVRAAGRFRYYRLASAEVGHALEALGLVATAPPPRLSLTRAQVELRKARRCYDHLAGVLGVALVGALERQGLLVPAAQGTSGWEVTPRGVAWFAASLEVDVPALARARRPLARRCLDWTERRPHVAGALGAAILHGLVARRWLAPSACRMWNCGRRRKARPGASS